MRLRSVSSKRQGFGAGSKNEGRHCEAPQRKILALLHRAKRKRLVPASLLPVNFTELFADTPRPTK